jgi:hypothetical protein
MAWYVVVLAWFLRAYISPTPPRIERTHAWRPTASGVAYFAAKGGAAEERSTDTLGLNAA